MSAAPGKDGRDDPDAVADDPDDAEDDPDDAADDPDAVEDDPDDAEDDPDDVADDPDDAAAEASPEEASPANIEDNPATIHHPSNTPAHTPKREFPWYHIPMKPGTTESLRHHSHATVLAMNVSEEPSSLPAEMDGFQRRLYVPEPPLKEPEKKERMIVNEVKTMCRHSTRRHQETKAAEPPQRSSADA